MMTKVYLELVCKAGNKCQFDGFLEDHFGEGRSPIEYCVRSKSILRNMIRDSDTGVYYSPPLWWGIFREHSNLQWGSITTSDFLSGVRVCFNATSDDKWESVLPLVDMIVGKARKMGFEPATVGSGVGSDLDTAAITLRPAWFPTSRTALAKWKRARMLIEQLDDEYEERSDWGSVESPNPTTEEYRVFLMSNGIDYSERSIRYIRRAMEEGWLD
jgi:hypothetical protein